MKKVLLVGATGVTGKALLKRLLDDSSMEAVYTLSRSELKLEHPKLRSFVLSFESLDAFSFPNTETIDQLYFCYGSTRKKAGSAEAFRHIEWELSQKIITLALRYKVKRVLLVSSLGANAKSKLLYPQIKGQIEELCRHLAFKEVVVFRPSLLLSEREERRPMEALAQGVFRPLKNVLQERLPKYAPVSNEELADSLLLWGKMSELKAPFIILENPEIIGSLKQQKFAT